MTRLFAINYRSRHWLAWAALLLPCALAVFGSIPSERNSTRILLFKYDAAWNLQSRTNNALVQTFTNGNLTSDGLRGFEYDDENRLTGITVTNSWKTLLIYDGLGRRRGRYEYLWFNGAWAWNLQVEYVYDGNVVVQERWGGDEPWINYTRGLDVSGTWQGAGGVGGLLAWSQKISGA